MTEKPQPTSADALPGVQEQASPWEGRAVLRTRGRPEGFSAEDAAREIMARFPKVMARLAE